jgi:ClpP class serine protease
LLAAGDKAYADPASIVGSIGVVADSFGFVNLIEKLGVDRRVQTAGTIKARNDPFKPQNNEDVAKTQKLLDEMHDVFKACACSDRAPPPILPFFKRCQAR